MGRICRPSTTTYPSAPSLETVTRALRAGFEAECSQCIGKRDPSSPVRAWLTRNVLSSPAPVTVTFVRDDRFSCHVKSNRISYSPASGIVAVNVCDLLSSALVVVVPVAGSDGRGLSVAGLPRPSVFGLVIIQHDSRQAVLRGRQSWARLLMWQCPQVAMTKPDRRPTGGSSAFRNRLSELQLPGQSRGTLPSLRTGSFTMNTGSMRILAKAEWLAESANVANRFSHSDCFGTMAP